jgi:hypothetical protein
MPRIDDFEIGIERSTGTISLSFTAAIANAGEGPLLIRADRRHRFSSDWRVDQRFRERDGSLSEAETPASLAWGGHGHEHWHVRFGASYELERRGASATVERTLRKAGFCFFDHVRSRNPGPASPTSPQFDKDTCDGLDRTSIDMGLSSGWEDPYYNFLPDQELDVTALPDGVYRLHAVADPDRVLRESDESNNATWVDLELTTSTKSPTVRIAGYGPSAGPRARI